MNRIDAADVLDRAAEVIRERGWSQGMTAAPDGSVCALGGILVVCGFLSLHMPQGVFADYLLAEHATGDVVLTCVAAPSQIIASWNDKKERTQEDVTTALEKAAAWVREQV